MVECAKCKYCSTAKLAILGDNLCLCPQTYYLLQSVGTQRECEYYEEVESSEDLEFEENYT